MADEYGGHRDVQVENISFRTLSQAMYQMSSYWLKRAGHSNDDERSEQGIHRRSSKSILHEVWCEWLLYAMTLLRGATV